MKKTVLLIVALLLLIPAAQGRGLRHCRPEAEGMDGRRLALADSVIDAAIAGKSIPGAVLAVVRGESIVYLKAYGNRQVVPDTVAMTTGTVFDLASLSKCVGTTIAVMQLAEQGYLRLTDPVSLYIPGFKPWKAPESARTREIRIVDLLSHSAGLPPAIDVKKYLSKYGPASPEALIRHIAEDEPRRFEPTTDYLYSCLNFITLQHIVENITGQRLCDYVQANVFDRLGLEHTCYNPYSEHPEIMPLVAPTEVGRDGVALLGEVHDPTARLVNCGNSGNAGVFSSAEDLAVIAAAIMNGGQINGRRILSPLSVETMVSVPEGNAPHIGRALGWDNRSTSATLRGDLFSRSRTICHTGYTGTSMVIDLDADCAVILLTHRVHPADKGSVAALRAKVANVVASSLIQ